MSNRINENTTAGEYVTDVDPVTYDQRKASNDPKQNIQLKKENDIAGIKRRAKYTSVYLVKDGENIKSIILPVHGYGLWSTLYGFIALKGDMDTIVGLGFYSHAETPGLGGEVDNPKWKALWEGKELYDDQGNVAITVVKGSAEAGNSHQVDGLSGATLTSRGVKNLVRFWVGDKAFGSLLTKLKEQGA